MSLLSKIKHILVFAFVLILVYLLFNSALDLYNNFAYDKAVLKDTPYGYTPLLQDPKHYSSAAGEIKSGEYVYVTDWISSYDRNIVFAKVKSKLSEGYINRDLLVKANFNVIPVVSSMLLVLIFSISFRRFVR